MLSAKSPAPWQLARTLATASVALELDLHIALVSWRAIGRVFIASLLKWCLSASAAEETAGQRLGSRALLLPASIQKALQL